MRLLLSVVVSIGFIYSSYAQSESAADLAGEEYPYSEDSVLNSETSSVSKDLISGEDIDTEVTTHDLKDDPAENRKDEEDGVENAGINVCGRPLVIEFAKTDRKKKAPYAIGTELNYSCDFGYSSDGTIHTSRCVESSDGGKPFWTDPQIVCTPRTCGDPGYVSDAQRTGSRFTFPNSVSFECDVGYVMKGLNIRYCQVSGRWSGSLPSCEEVFCGEPEHPENGHVSFTSLGYRSKLRYECDSGYLLKNHQQPRVCTEDGSWSGPEPICQEAQCEKPVAPDHGFVDIAGKPRIGSIALYTCEPGRRLVGSGTSKCLDTGEWMFDTPQCLDPCNVPNVANGLIGRYERSRNRQRHFVELPTGTVIGGRDELYLRCSNGYEPLGEHKLEVEIACEQGIWKNDPVCKPAKCRGNPPSMKNGTPFSIGREQGQYVVYHCTPHTKKTKYGNVTCHFGQWRGVTPICTDERCFIDTITFPGLVKLGKTVYYNGQSVAPVCEKGYDIVDPQNRLTCNKGKWEGQFPPCRAADCLNNPPSIQNGRIKDFSQIHSSLVEYECDEGYFLQGLSQVQCLFGEWKNNAPVCKDSSCYFENLVHKSGMLVPSKNPVRSGETIDIRCASGFSPLNIKPICSRGTWQEYGKSPCQPNDCVVPSIQDGALTEKKSISKYLGFKKEITYVQVNIGSKYKAGHSFYVSCIHGTTFQGKNMNDVPTECIRGKWKPSPICAEYGTIIKEDEEISDELIQLTKAPDLPSTTAVSAALPRNALQTASKEVINPVETTSRNTVSDENCFCLYRGSDALVAFAGQDQIRFGSKVKSGCTVTFFCKEFGFYRLRGPKELRCEDCRTWDSSEYPGCDVPQRGQTILSFDPSFFIEPGGILTLDQGLSPQIECISNGINNYPVWRTNVEPSLWTSYTNHYNQHGISRLSTTLVLHHVSTRHNGVYSCGLYGYESQEFELKVKPQCIKFEETGEMMVHYDKGQKIDSSAMFSCKDRRKKLDGARVLTCMVNGEWSGKPPKCVAPRCPALNESEGMRIEYSDALNLGSTATFHCLLPRKRKGNPFINCLLNGEWSGKVPSCTQKNCPVGEITEKLPKDVVPYLKGIDDEEVPYGFEVPLTCEGELRLSQALPIKCGDNGLWEVPPVRCIQGCQFAETNSNLIVEPKMDFYRFGDIVALSCGPGQNLTSQVEILMCLTDGWSEEIPSCKDAEISETILEEKT